MADSRGRSFRFSPTLVLVLVVLALAAGALVPWDFVGGVPGTLRLGVLAEESALRMERATGPLANWLAGSVGRAGEVVAPGQAGFDELAQRCDLMLVAEPAARGLDHSRILAWIRPVARATAYEDFILVRGRNTDAPRVCAATVAGLMDEDSFAACDSLFLAGSPFAGRELLRAFVAGAYASVLVRGSVLEDARRAGWLAGRPQSLTPAATNRPWMALVSSRDLDSDLRRRLRESLLTLDKYRLDPSRTRATAVVNALAEIGIAGFAPTEPFAALRR